MAKLDTPEDFLKKALPICKDRIGLNKFVYTKSNKKSIAVCLVNPLHPDFYITSNKIMSGVGCPECAGNKQKNLTTIFKEIQEVHGDRFSLTENSRYLGANIKLELFCNECKVPFLISPKKCKSGQGHRDCSRTKAALGRTQTFIEFSDRSECAHTFSKAQQEVEEYLRSLGVELESNVKLPSGLEVDILVKSKNIAIEYNGLRWHSDQFRPPTFHLRKTLECQSIGLRLIHIYEDEWLFKQKVVKALLAVVLGKCKTKRSARKCVVKPVSWVDYKNFNDLHHLQGTGMAPCLRLGLWENSSLVAVMGFSNRESSPGEIELVRFSSDGLVRGAFSKLLTHSKKYLSNSITKIVSFSDLRWSLGSVYSTNGFKRVSRSKPTYWYVVKSTREDKRRYQRKYLPSKLKVFDSNLSESENCKANGLYRIFDCGKDRWELLL